LNMSAAKVPGRSHLVVHAGTTSRKLLFALVRRDIDSLSLLESLVCPGCKGGLAMEADAVRCDACRLVYRSWMASPCS
jgi:hypothetical protein